MNRARAGRQLSRPVAFWAAAGVLVLALWASSAPAMVYPVYVSEWGATPLSTTALFAAYPVVLVISLIGCGSLSDWLGRRRVILAGLSFVALGTLVFVVADSFPFLYAGRGLQGAGVGLAISPAAAALLDFETSGSSSRASAVNTAATSTGAVVAILLGGALVQYAPVPARSVFLTLFTATLLLMIVLWFLPETTVSSRRRWLRALRFPETRRTAFFIGCGTLAAAFMMGGVFLSLGAQIARDLTGAGNAFLVATALSTWPLVGVPAAFLARRVAPRTAAVLGGPLAAFGSLALLPAALTTSLPIFFLSCAASGFGYGLLFYAGVGVVSANAIPGERAGSLAAMYLVAYVAQAVAAVATGALATSEDLLTAVIIGMPAMALCCGVASLLNHYVSLKSPTSESARPRFPSWRAGGG